MTQTFSCSIDVSAPPEVVFDYFTTAEFLVLWIGDYAVLVAQPGGEFTLDIEGIPVRGEFLEIVEHERVVVSWGHAGSDVLPPGSTQVEFRLTPLDTGTRIEIEHRDLPLDQVENHSVGWPMFLGRLGDRLT